ncbi:hypothetical protein PSM36_2852 [Proteiniphilum saccharofermentans]|uniref:Secreted protein n=1 Tax=Proteiniphilum saccharofermentans TaxID=1642647 RepID=A0A1R3TAK4_9BACT|nr:MULTISPECIES: hypothetical protein [Proteiniphilum]SCD21647.1 hypothetical protein PSM36_2852 [Proteiniphilum saccharofermentans]
MNKLLFLSIMILTSLGFISCGDDDAPVLGAKVQVTVKNMAGTAQTNTTVYLYKNTEIDGSTKSTDADKYVVTDENGIATFNLNFTELNILEFETTLSFAVFYEVGEVEFVAPGSTSVTVKRNDEKEVDITIPF